MLTQTIIEARTQRQADELLEMTNALRSAVPAMIVDNDGLLGLPNDSAIVRDWTMVKASNSADIVLMQVEDAYIAYGLDALKAFTWLKATSHFDEDLRLVVKVYPANLERLNLRATEEGITLQVAYR